MRLLEEFVVVDAPLERVERVMTEQALMERWMSPAVRFEPLGEWRFKQGDRWTLTLTGLGDLLPANYIVAERRPGLVLWAFNGFWEGFDAWHWFQAADGRSVIQNRIEYELRYPGLDLIWGFTVGPLMGWDARQQMQRLKEVTEQ